jgi:hypothetical protein
MNRIEEQKANQPANGFLFISFISILSFIIFSAQVYGSSDIPVNAAAAPAAIGAAAGFDVSYGLNSHEIFTVVKADIGSSASSSFLTAFQDEDAVYTESLVEVGTVNGSKRAAHPQCQHDSCSL